MAPCRMALALIALSVLLSSNVLSDGCTQPADLVEYIGTETIMVDKDQIWTGERLVNGSLIIDSNLKLIECDLTITGEGIIIKENGSLVIERSTVSSYTSQPGYYIESSGTLFLDDSLIDGALDPANGYVGIYLIKGSFEMKRSTIEKSGLVRSGLDDNLITNSSLTGLVSFGGNTTIVDSVIDGVGVSMEGYGHLEIMRTHITSNLSFSNSISAISSEEGRLIINDVSVNGSFGGGVYTTGSGTEIKNITITIPDSLYGIRAHRCSVLKLDGIYIEGPFGGIEIENCTYDSIIRSAVIHSGHHGIHKSGYTPMIIDRITIRNMSYGMISEGPLSMSGTMIETVEVGIRLIGDRESTSLNCTIKDFSMWGLELESWEPINLEDIIFLPGNDALTNYTMWGDVTIDVVGPMSEPVDINHMIISSSIGGESEIQPGRVGLVWGYISSYGDVVEVEYNLIASWANARSEVQFNVTRGKKVVIELPLADIFVSSLRLDEEDAVVEVGVRNSEAKGVVVTCYLDGSYRFDRKVNLLPGEIIELRMPIGPVEEGKHELSCSVTSNDEYSTSSTHLLANNHMSVPVEKTAEDNNRGTELLIILILTIAIVMIIVTIVFRRRD